MWLLLYEGTQFVQENPFYKVLPPPSYCAIIGCERKSEKSERKKSCNSKQRCCGIMGGTQ